MLDNFFDIGGDSLKAIELTAKLDELNNSLEQLYEDWENIQLKIAEYEE